ncbi:Hsp20/alpha crystallin family protein [Calditerrivibrio nitroreducens]|uniref:Heat shock protein Hsp20 n=1 Tax=Calditerrivibrio nitroreducens (strain DSM 19672 / NBRC 101217 / Yu37-1) TaxID=768670 RepID=E4TFG8_CALNY|nr:Hsp20/alpha crystallin family protein [Calditerrivibrio nitroreducens]ADR19541.1 heat shock protein Hsp20 [Calditerrivibrio nitroreducens DSM 19672]
MDELSSLEKIVLIHGLGGEISNILTRIVKDVYEQGHFPPVDISLRNDSVVVWIELAGVKRENVKIYLYEDLLVMEGIIRPAKADNYNFLRVERNSNPFRRIVKLPVKVDSKNFEARFENGVFRIEFKRMPKEFVLIKLTEDGGQ